MAAGTSRSCLNPLKAITVSIFASLIVAACGPTTQVILLPNPDGKVGSLEVTDKKGSQTLDQAWQSTETSMLTGSQSAPKVIGEQQARAAVRQALEAEPMAPATFVMQFKSGSADLTPESLRVMTDVMEAVRVRKSTDIIVSGHTDSVGSEDYNQDAFSAPRKVGGECPDRKGHPSRHYRDHLPTARETPWSRHPTASPNRGTAASR